MLKKEYWTRSFNLGFNEIKLRITVDDDQDILVTPYVNGQERLYFLGIDPIVEASVVIAFDKYFRNTLDTDIPITDSVLDELICYVESLIKKGMFDAEERRLLLNRLLMHYDFMIRNMRAHLYRDIRKGKIRPVK